MSKNNKRMEIRVHQNANAKFTFKMSSCRHQCTFFEKSADQPPPVELNIGLPKDDTWTATNDSLKSTLETSTDPKRVAFRVGDRVKMIETITSDDEREVQLTKGGTGTIIVVDEEGDVVIRFENPAGNFWVYKEKFYAMQLCWQNNHF